MHLEGCDGKGTRISSGRRVSDDRELSVTQDEVKMFLAKARSCFFVLLSVGSFRLPTGSLAVRVETGSVVRGRAHSVPRDRSGYVDVR